MVIRLTADHGLYKEGMKLEVIKEFGEQLIKDGKAMAVVSARHGVQEGSIDEALSSAKGKAKVVRR